MPDAFNGFDYACDAVFLPVPAGNGAKRYATVLLAPLCSTFSGARFGDGGPAQWCDANGPGRYGRSDLSIQDRGAVRLGSLSALRALQAFAAAHSAGVLATLENPAPWRDREGCVSCSSLFALDEARARRRP